MEITKLNDHQSLLSNEVETTYAQCTETNDVVHVQPGIVNRLLVKHVQLITQYEKEVDDYPD